MMTFHRIISEEFVVGKAYLLFQKFLKKDAFLHIDCVSEGLQQNMEKKLNDAIAAAENSEAQCKIGVDFFDEALREVESVMARTLFDPYFQSEFYQKYKKGIQIAEGLQVV